MWMQNFLRCCDGKTQFSYNFFSNTQVKNSRLKINQFNSYTIIFFIIFIFHELIKSRLSPWSHTKATCKHFTFSYSNIFNTKFYIIIQTSDKWKIIYIHILNTELTFPRINYKIYKLNFNCVHYG